MPAEGTINNKLEHSIINDKSSKQWEKSVRRLRAKEDALEANMVTFYFPFTYLKFPMTYFLSLFIPAPHVM